MAKASVGRVVHYWPKDQLDDRYDGVPFAAIVTAVLDGEGRAVDLSILYPHGAVEDRIPEYGPIYVYDEERRPGTWSWPERTN